MSTTKQCSVIDCHKLYSARGFCATHYERFRTTGDPQAHLPIGRPGGDPGPEPRFWRRVTKGDGCWLWSGTMDSHGYGKMRVEGKNTKAHRFAYSINIGPIPDGLVIDHLCRNRRCVNPAHLEAVTQAENVRRGDACRIQNGRASACVHGHLYTHENTYRRTNGTVACRECQRTYNRLRRIKTRSEQAMK